MFIIATMKPTNCGYKRILIFGDLLANSELAETLLHNYQCAITTDLKESLHYLEHFKPDLILLDILFPRLKGLDLYLEIKKHPLHNNIPVLNFNSLQNTDAKIHFLKACTEYQFEKDNQKSSTANREFLTLMSHEIRTSLTGMIGMVDLTLMTRLNSEQLENLVVAKACSHSILDILGKLMDFYKVDASHHSQKHSLIP